MKLFKRESSIWLSEIVQQDFRKQYPQFDLKKIQVSRWKRVLQNFPLSFRLAFAVFALGIIMNSFFLAQGWVLSTYELDSQGAFEIVASSLEYLAGLVGIVLPIILIVVEFVSRDKSASSLVDLYLEKTTLKTTTYWALGLLGFEAIFLTVFRTNIIKPSQILFSIVFLFTLLNLAAIFETGKTIWNLRNSLNSTFLTTTLASKLTAEILRNQVTEIEKRLGRLHNVKIYEELGLERSSYSDTLQNALVIYAPKSGVLVDIHLPNLQDFSEAVKSPSAKTVITKLVNDSIEKGEIIAYVPGDSHHSLADLTKIIQRSYKIKEESRSSDEITTLMEQVKQAVEASIRGENRLSFDEFTTIYLEIFELGIGLPIPPSTEWLNDLLFRGWRTSQLAIRHMEDFVEIATRSSNREYIDALSYDIFSIASSMIQKSDVIVDDNLSEVLNLYVSMYVFSHKYKNELGINRSCFYLTHDIVRIWTSHLMDSVEDIQAVKNYYKVLSHILITLSRILRHTIANQDLVTFKKLLNFTQPKELLFHFDLNHSLRNKYFALIRGQEENSENVIITDQIKALKLAIEIPKNAQDFFDKFTFLLTSYLLESYEQDELTIRRLGKMLSILEPYLLSLEQTVTVFSQLIENRSLSWDLFTRHPDTKGGYFPDDEDKLFLFYCVRGMSIIGKTEVRATFLVDLRYQLPRIEATCNRIVGASSKWVQTPFFLRMESELPELAQKWIELNKEITQRWLVKYEDQIINCDPDASKVKAFLEGVEQSVRERSKTSFRSLLERYNKLVVDNGLNNHNQIWMFQEKQYFTKLYGDDAYAKELGKQYGSWLVHKIDTSFVQFCKSKSRSLRTSKSWQNFQPYFDRFIEKFRKTGHNPSCFLVPTNRHLYEWLTNTPGFQECFQTSTQEEIPMLEGFYKDIPIYEYLPGNSITPYALVLDLEKALRLKMGELTTEVRNITPEEIQRGLTNNPEKDQRVFLLSISTKASLPFDFELLDREALLHMKLNLPVEPSPRH